MAAARRTFKLAIGGGALFVVAALLWWLVAVPALVKYPSDLDVTPRYEGTLSLFVNPANGGSLATPQKLPLTIERHLEAQGDETGASRVVVKETITQKAGTVLSAVEHNSYVMDRRSMENVADPRAYAFAPQNVVDRSGAYRLQLPMGTDGDGKYQVYKNETGASYPLIGDAKDATTEVEGLTLSNFNASAKDVPLSAAYLAGLRKILPLPTEVTFEQLKPQLAAAGIDFDKTLAGVVAVMSAEDRAALLGAMAKPLKMQYLSSFEGRVAVEPRTGTEVDIVGITETISARPVIENFDQLQGLLTKYISEPAIQAAVPALTTLASAPASPLFKYDYTQTAASVADIAAEAKDMQGQIALAERWVPISLLVVGLLALLLAGVSRIKVSRLQVKLPSGSGTPSRPKTA